jgi:putative IMPACT (imprinted ancient) family translation regulator
VKDNDDDGESAAGSRLAHLLSILSSSSSDPQSQSNEDKLGNVLVIVTRYFGGIHLGPDRFKHINQAARDALEVGGFLQLEDDLGEEDPGRKRGGTRR